MGEPKPEPEIEGESEFEFKDLSFLDRRTVMRIMEVPSKANFLTIEHMLQKYPTSVELRYVFGTFQLDFHLYEEALESFAAAKGIVSRLTGEVASYWVKEKERIRKEERVPIDPAKLFYSWAPLKPLPPGLSAPNINNVNSSWAQIRSDPALLKQLMRLWSIETGKVEKLYQITDGSTKSLIKLGFISALVDHSDDIHAVQAAQIMQDQFLVIELIMDRVGTNQAAITAEFLCLLQEMFTTHARFTTLYQIDSGESAEALIRRGRFKVFPNNPTRQDNLIHQYCPVSKVAEEVARLLALYKEYDKPGADPIVLAAWLHHRFVQIHPFQDGNGRVARAIASIPLLKANLPPLVVLDSERLRYFECLQKADKDDDLKPLIAFFADSLISAVKVIVSPQP